MATTMMVDDSGGASASKTVRFDVGGMLYKVSRSLIELYPDTMLARMVDTKWQQQDDDSEQAMFIDRNGDRFQYVLDYMRDRQVSLPMTVSVSGFRQDLEYYGFDNVKESCINVGTPAEAMPLFGTLTGNLYSDIDEFDDLIKESERKTWNLKRQKNSLKMAHQVFGRCASMQGNGPHTIRFEKEDARSCASAALSVGLGEDSGYLKEYLANYYGLGLVSVTTETEGYFTYVYVVVVQRCACDHDGGTKPSRIWAQPDDYDKNVEPDGVPVVASNKATSPVLCISILCACVVVIARFLLKRQGN